MVEFPAKFVWPVSLLIMVFAFKGQIGGFIDRMTEAGPQGAKAVPPNQRSEKPSEAADATLKSEPLPDDPDLALWESIIRNQIKEAGIENDPNLTERLIKALAYSNRRADFEQIARIIFGSQIGALKQLNDKGPQTETELTPWFAYHRDRTLDVIPAYDNFTDWIWFLRRYILVDVNSEAKYTITQWGQQLLGFLMLQGIDHRKPF